MIRETHRWRRSRTVLYFEEKWFPSVDDVADVTEQCWRNPIAVILSGARSLGDFKELWGDSPSLYGKGTKGKTWHVPEDSEARVRQSQVRKSYWTVERRKMQAQRMSAWWKRKLG